jgi:GR25 family glycosyltransferase involved in LPS biosynthesis
MDKVLKSPAFVIHLQRNEQREPFFKKYITDAGYENIKVFEAVDGKDENSVNETLNMFQSPTIHPTMSKGQIGCMLSHFKVLKHIIDHNIELATVFEDDVCFHPEWKTLYNIYYNSTPEYDMIFLGNQLDIIDRDHSNSVVIEATYCTHAYIITLEGARKLLEGLLRWDYTQYLHCSNKNQHGLIAIDMMIRDIQQRALQGKIDTPFRWYCWNGTKFPCDYWRLPVTAMTCKNSGLVFQNMDFTSSIVGSELYIS